MSKPRDITKRGPRAPMQGASDAAAVDAFLSQVATMPKTPGAGSGGRLIFALDATASREATWDRACHLQGEMFEATAALGQLDIQLVYYRGFRECRAGRWVRRAADLHKLMRGVACVGGHTQIIRILKHALKEHAQKPVNAVVFVGDALEEDIDELCHQAGRLGLAGVPVFMFHEGGNAIVGKAFRQVARLSGGAYAPFDLNSAETLKRLLSAVAVYAVGGLKALAATPQKDAETLLLTQQLRGGKRG